MFIYQILIKSIFYHLSLFRSCLPLVQYPIIEIYYFTTTVKADFYSSFQMLAKVDKIRAYATF